MVQEMLRVAHRKDQRTTAALADAVLKNVSKSSCAKAHSGFSSFFALPQLRSRRCAQVFQ
jgi:hypothetical protein